MKPFVKNHSTTSKTLLSWVNSEIEKLRKERKKERKIERKNKKRKRSIIHN